MSRLKVVSPTVEYYSSARTFKFCLFVFHLKLSNLEVNANMFPSLILPFLANVWDFIISDLVSFRKESYNFTTLSEARQSKNKTKRKQTEYSIGDKKLQARKSDERMLNPTSSVWDWVSWVNLFSTYKAKMGVFESLVVWWGMMGASVKYHLYQSKMCCFQSQFFIVHLRKFSKSCINFILWLWMLLFFLQQCSNFN